ncbi:hypothetical protein [Geodermatophilus maliterrae]|uniref:Winged helix-turn-helix domain-containing protein n=1 Tax=Geodermatophilus maliterrae TaxID=3162531 RepID=A0ABV3XB79_9ACTN
MFRGGWTLDAVQAVATGDGLDRATVVDVLGRLVDRSLVIADREPVDRDAGPRYHLLETIREYARQRLAESAEEDRIARAHGNHLTDLAERAEADLRGGGQARWLRRLALERDDIEAALAWCTEHAASEPDAGLRLDCAAAAAQSRTLFAEVSGGERPGRRGEAEGTRTPDPRPASADAPPPAGVMLTSPDARIAVLS